MKVSREWLQTYFDSELPASEKIAEAITFHAFEIESIESDVLDVKVTPNRGHDALSHRTIANEISAILKIPMRADPLRQGVSLEPKTDALKIVVEDQKRCPRFTAAYIRNVKVGPSPDWLHVRLEAVGQKSINNIVDATNFVMFNIGQPLHAFDAEKLGKRQKPKGNSELELHVRNAKKGERLVGLDDKEYTLDDSMLAIADGKGEVVSIAGIKGGKPTGIDEQTTDLILEAANWDGVMIRKTSRALGLRTDASDRFQQQISPELAAYGIGAAAKLVLEIAGGELVGFVDEYPTRQGAWTVSVSTTRINALLGTSLEDNEVVDAFERLGLPFEKNGKEFVVSVPFERLDLTIPEDLVEEVARIVGYDKIPATELPPFDRKPEVNENFYASEAKREELIAKGYSEVFTSVFADTGERAVANKVDSVRPYLRSNLTDGLEEALERNARNKDLLGLNDVRLFEIGTVWIGGKEEIHVATIGENEKPQETRLEPMRAESYDNLPVSQAIRYQPFSRYPFIVRDVALWTPQGTEPVEVLNVVRLSAGDLLVRSELFDTFEKGRKTSYAFRLVFQSFDRTLTDEDANKRMESVYNAVKKEGWEVR